MIGWSQNLRDFVLGSKNKNVILRQCNIIILLIFPLTVNAQTDFIRTSGDIIQIALPASAFGTTLLERDMKGTEQMALGFGVNFAATHGLKRIINKERPNGGQHAFPSGHTAAAFQGATFIYKRYGKQYGIPALALAGFVGYSRTVGDLPPHDFWDVFGGAILGSVCGIILTKSREEKIQLSPVISQNSLILSARITIGS